MGEVTNIADRSGNGLSWSPRQALERAIERIEEPDNPFNGKKVLIVALDDRDGRFDIAFVQAGMLLSECNNLCDFAKTIFKRKMGY